MSLRVIIGVVALAGVSGLGLASTLVFTKMVDEVNSGLSKEMHFELVGWYPQKTLRLLHEYRRLFPDGSLFTKFWTMFALMLVCLLAVAWALGFF